jgi:hypothetical protein
VCLTACLTLSPEGYIPAHRLPLKTLSKECCFYVNAAFMSTSQGSFIMPLKDFRNMSPISNNEQQTTGNSGLPGLSGCQRYSLCWDPLFFPIVTLLPLFPRGSRLLSRTPPTSRSTQFGSPTGPLQLSKARIPADTLSP